MRLINWMSTRSTARADSAKGLCRTPGRARISEFKSRKSAGFRLTHAAACLIGLAGLLPLTAAHAQNEFDGDWASFGGTYQPDGQYTWRVGTKANQWSILGAKSADRILPVHDVNSPIGRVVAHVLVKPGDNIGYTGERAEVSYMLGAGGLAMPVTSASGHEYYGLSVKLAPNWVSPGKDYGTSGCIWGIFLQLHSPDVYDSPPAIALAAENDFHLNMDTGDLLQGGTQTQYKPNISYAFSNGTLVRNKWVSFLLDIVWASDNTGSITVYRRDAGQANFAAVLSLQNVPTLQTKYGVDPGAHYHYWKTGFYRSTTPNMTSELWLGPLVRGTNASAVMASAFPASR